MTKYTEYALIFSHPSGRIGSRPFDWCDFDILEESNEMDREQIANAISDRGIFLGYWGREKCAAVRSERSPKMRAFHNRQLKKWRA